MLKGKKLDEKNYFIIINELSNDIEMTSKSSLKNHTVIYKFIFIYFFLFHSVFNILIIHKVIW